MNGQYIAYINLKIISHEQAVQSSRFENRVPLQNSISLFAKRHIKSRFAF